MSRADEINDKKGQIALAITIAIANNSNLDFNYLFKYVKNRVCDATAAVAKMEPFLTTYDRKLKELIKEVNELVFYDVSLYLNGKDKIINPVNEEDKYSKDIVEKYYENFSTYIKIGLTLDKFSNLYSYYGENIKMVNSKIKKLVRSAFLSDFKRDLSSLNDVFNYKRLIKSNDTLLDEYNIKSIEDFIDFRNEVLSFTIEEDNLGDEEKEFVLENREAYKKRSNIVISKKDANILLKKIDAIFNLEAFKTIFSDGCWKDIVSRIGLNYRNISNITSSYIALTRASAICSKFYDKDCKEVVYCIFPEKMFDSSNKTIKDTIIHEFVHSVDLNNINNIASFSSKYSMINEAITEYFAIEASKYVSDDWIDVNNEGNRVGTLYDSMLPLVYALKESEIWEDVLTAKLNDDVTSLEKKIGSVNMFRIQNCFITNFITDQNLEEKNLKKIISIIDKELKRNI